MLYSCYVPAAGSPHIIDDTPDRQNMTTDREYERGNGEDGWIETYRALGCWISIKDDPETEAEADDVRIISAGDEEVRR